LGGESCDITGRGKKGGELRQWAGKNSVMRRNNLQQYGKNTTKR
jgi:hypothetical protein